MSNDKTTYILQINEYGDKFIDTYQHYDCRYVQEYECSTFEQACDHFMNLLKTDLNSPQIYDAEAEL